jgi:hypothetical protein
MKTLALVAAALLFSGPIALAGQETLWTGTRPNDYFDLLLLKESTERWVAIVGLIVAGVLAVVVYARTSHVRSEIEKKIEDEFNEIKQRYDMDLDPKSQVLTENQRLQNLKDVFQTIAQGQCGALDTEVNHGRHGKTHGRHQTSSGLFAFASLWLAKMNVKRSLSRAFRTIPCFP